MVLAVLTTTFVASPETARAEDESRTVCPSNRLLTGRDVPDAARGFDGGAGLVGHGVIWTRRPNAPDYSVDGTWGFKQPWLRLATGKLKITGRRIGGGGGRFHAELPPVQSYSATGILPSNLYFSRGGCWQVRGKLRSSSAVLYVNIDDSKQAICSNLAGNLRVIDESQPANAALADRIRGAQATKGCI